MYAEIIENVTFGTIFHLPSPLFSLAQPSSHQRYCLQSLLIFFRYSSFYLLSAIGLLMGLLNKIIFRDDSDIHALRFSASMGNED